MGPRNKQTKQLFILNLKSVRESSSYTNSRKKDNEYSTIIIGGGGGPSA